MRVRDHLSAVGMALLVVATSSQLWADDVHLANGNSFEGVIATVEGSRVKIRLPLGEISLPLSRVLHIEKNESALQKYLDRKAALLLSEAARAEDWLELARWAESQDLAPGHRESALTAARLDPELPELGPILRKLGYVLEEDLKSWVPFREAMHRRGYVYDRGEWITREEREARAQVEREALARLRAERAERTAEVALATAIEARVQAEVAREVAEIHSRQGLVSATPVVVGTFFPAFFPLLPHPQHPGAAPVGPSEPPRDHGEVVNPFAPPGRQILLERDFGGGLGAGLPNGWGGAPGRLRQLTQR